MMTNDDHNYEKFLCVGYFFKFTASVIQSALDYLFASVSVISLMWKFRPKYISTTT